MCKSNVIRYLPVIGATPARPTNVYFIICKSAAMVQNMISLCHRHFQSRAETQKDVHTRWRRGCCATSTPNLGVLTISPLRLRYLTRQAQKRPICYFSSHPALSSSWHRHRPSPFSPISPSLFLRTGWPSKLSTRSLGRCKRILTGTESQCDIWS